MRCNAYLKLGSKIDPYTYIDQETNEEVTVSMRKWITTKGLDHMESDHPEHPLGVKRRARREKQAHNRVAALTQKMHGPEEHCGDVKETSYVQEAKAAQARSYIYCRGRMSKSPLMIHTIERVCKQLVHCKPIFSVRYWLNRRFC